jgi:hypothetical protein
MVSSIGSTPMIESPGSRNDQPHAFLNSSYVMREA